MPLASFNKAPLKNRSAQYSLNPCIKTMLLVLKRVTRLTPLQFFGQLAVKNDRSQFLNSSRHFLAFLKNTSTLGFILFIGLDSVNSLEAPRHNVLRIAHRQDVGRRQ